MTDIAVATDTPEGELGETAQIALRYLHRADGPHSLVDVARAVAVERGPGAGPAGGADLRAAYLELRRQSVPELERRNLVEYAEDLGELRLLTE